MKNSGLRRQYSTTLFLVLAIGAGLLIALFLGRHKEEEAIREDPTQELESVIPAPASEPTSEEQKLQKFSLTGFDDDGMRFWNLEGDTAEINPDKNVYLDQNVTLRLRDETVIRTNRVQWSQEEGLLKTPSSVEVDHQNVKITGVGAVGRPNEGFVQLNRDIRMVINQLTELTCEGPMKIFYKENKIIFYRKVRVIDERGTVAANRMDVFIDPTDKKIKEVVAIGDVVITRGADITRSNRAIYNVITGSMRLEGNPEITLNQGSGSILDESLDKDLF